METGTKFLRAGIHYDDLSEEEQEEWDRIEWSDSGEVPESVDAAALNTWLYNTDTIDQVLKALMENGLKVAGGDRLVVVAPELATAGGGDHDPAVAGVELNRAHCFSQATCAAFAASWMTGQAAIIWSSVCRCSI